MLERTAFRDPSRGEESFHLLKDDGAGLTLDATVENRLGSMSIISVQSNEQCYDACQFKQSS
jgi:hypothetical protein